MEQISGLAWITGHEGDQPRIQQGPCDPLAGMHGGFALHVGLAEREATGEGCLLEVPMVEGALKPRPSRSSSRAPTASCSSTSGNRSPGAAPQGLYPCAGRENWLSLSFETDEQWHGLRKALGSPAWATDGALDTHAGSAGRHDRDRRAAAAWAADRDVESTVEHLVSHGVPAAVVATHGPCRRTRRCRRAASTRR